MDNRRIEVAGEFGTDCIENVVPFPTLVASSSVTVNLGVPYREVIFNQAYVAQFTLGTFGGTATVTIQKTSSGTTTSLTAAQDLTSGTQTARKTAKITRLASLTDAQRTLQPGDVLEAVFTLGSTVSVQPGGATVGAETYLRK